MLVYLVMFSTLTSQPMLCNAAFSVPASAKKVCEDVANNVAVWTILRSKDKDYLELMERVRSGSYQPCDEVAAMIPPLKHALAALPPSATTRSTGKVGQVDTGALVTPGVAGMCSLGGAQNQGAAAGNAKTLGDTGGGARQMSYPQATSAAATTAAAAAAAGAAAAAAAAAARAGPPPPRAAAPPPRAAPPAAASYPARPVAAPAAATPAAAAAIAAATAAATAVVYLKKKTVDTSADGTDQHRGASFGGVSRSIKGAAGSGVSQSVRNVERVSPGAVRGVAGGVGSSGVCRVNRNAGRGPPVVGGLAPGNGRVARGVGSAGADRSVQGAGGVATGVGSAGEGRLVRNAWGVAPGIGEVPSGVERVPAPGVVPGVGGVARGVGSANVSGLVHNSWGVAPGVGGLIPGFGGFVPGLGGLMQGFGLAPFGRMSPLSNLVVMHEAAGGATPQPHWVGPAVVSPKAPALTSVERQRRHRAKKARKEQDARLNATFSTPNESHLLGKRK